MTYDIIQLRAIAPACGVEIGGVDLSADINEATVKEIRRALLQFRVIFFRHQDITPDQHLAFARRFGDLVDYPMVTGLDGYPDIVPVVKLEHETHNFGGIWHSDTTYLAQPPMGAILVARELPPEGGDTLFANMVMAYEALSDAMRGFLEGLTAEHSGALNQTLNNADPINARIETIPDPVVHPVVRTHPETGQKALFVNEGFTARIDGWSDDESRRLLSRLYQHCMEDRFIYRHQWRSNDLVMWDNRCTMHCATPYDLSHERSMHRATIRGNLPV